LTAIIELNQQRQVDANKRNQKNHGEIRESLDLLCLFPTNLQLDSPAEDCS